MKKAKQTLPVLGSLLSVLPLAQRLTSAKKLLPSRLNREAIEFGPGTIASIRKICVILPDDHRKALQCMSLIHSLHKRTGDADVLLIAEESVMTWCQSIMPASQISSYMVADRFLISRVMRDIHQSMVSFKPDLMVYLSDAPDPALCWLVGKSGARIRLGFSRDIFPYINVSVPAGNASCFSDQLAGVLVPLGIASIPFRKVSVDAQARSECEMMLSEMRIPAQAKIVLIDGDGISACLDTTIFPALIAKIQNTGLIPVVYTADASLGMHGANWSGIPILGPIPVSRLAALIGRAHGVIAGITVFAEMTRLIGTKISICGANLALKQAFKPWARCTFVVLDEIDQGGLVSLLVQTISSPAD